MSYSIHLNKSLEIVNVIYSGTVSLEMRKQAVEQVCSNYSHLKPLKILVDVRDLVMDISFEDQQAFGEHLANHPGLTHARAAVLHKHDFNPNVVIDDSAYNNGYLLSQFSSRTNAESWLLGEIY
jgi:hypothetical protein